MRDSRASVDRARAVFERVTRYATTPLALRVRHELKQIAGRVAAGDGEAITLADRAGQLARMRAYVIPVSEVALEGRECIGELEDWGVPRDVIDRLEHTAVPDLASSDEGAARVALHAIYEQYDYWDWYVDVYARSLRTITIAMLALITAAAIGAFLLLYHQHLYAGVVCMGVTGASAGILVKIPRAMIARVMGLVVSDIVVVRGKSLPVRRSRDLANDSRPHLAG